jgi:hypothetical protein
MSAEYLRMLTQLATRPEGMTEIHGIHRDVLLAAAKANRKTVASMFQGFLKAVRTALHLDDKYQPADPRTRRLVASVVKLINDINAGRDSWTPGKSRDDAGEVIETRPGGQFDYPK